MPQLGEVRLIQYTNSNIYRIWSACIDCGKERWVDKGNQHLRCRKCNNIKNGLLQRLPKVINNTTPKENEIRRASEIGKNGNHRFIYQACNQCGKLRWTKLSSPNNICSKCQSINASTRYPDIPISKDTPPNTNEIRRGKYINKNKNPSNFYQWIPCQDCRKLRWVLLVGHKLTRKRCPHCANLARRLNRPFNNTPPTINETRMGEEIGKTPHKRYIWVACSVCNKPRWQSLKRNKPESDVCRKCFPIKYCGDKSPHWQGRTITANGYIQITLLPSDPYFNMGAKRYNGKTSIIAEHRLVMAQYLGRYLESWEKVHHKNGIKSDNRIENLELITDKEHLILHSKGYRDGYAKGYADGQKAKLNELLTHIRLLEFHLRASGIIIPNNNNATTDI